MTKLSVPTTPTELRKLLVAEGLLRPLPAQGLTGFSDTFERVLAGVTAAIRTAMAGIERDIYTFPPLLPEPSFLATGYLDSFPHLVGSLQVFDGDDATHRRMARARREGDDWTTYLSHGHLNMVAAACHSLYPTLSGQILDRARCFEVNGSCFRFEPSPDPFRLISFRIHEHVCVGSPDDARAHRDLGLDLGPAFLASIGLPISALPANDPFFGRAGTMLANSQREQSLKYEFVCRVYVDHPGVALGSVNYHLDHFGADFDMRLPDGSPAHSACFGFGLERITTALFALHGTDIADWPSPVRETLGLCTGT